MSLWARDGALLCSITCSVATPTSGVLQGRSYMQNALQVPQLGLIFHKTLFHGY